MMEKIMLDLNKSVLLDSGNFDVSTIKDMVNNSTDWILRRTLAKIFGYEAYKSANQDEIDAFLDEEIKKRFSKKSANEDSEINLDTLTRDHEIVLRQLHEHAIDERNTTIATLKKFAALILLVNLGLAIIGTIQGVTGQPTTGATGFQVVANLVVLAWFLLQND